MFRCSRRNQSSDHHLSDDDDDDEEVVEPFAKDDVEVADPEDAAEGAEEDEQDREEDVNIDRRTSFTPTSTCASASTTHTPSVGSRCDFEDSNNRTRSGSVIPSCGW